MKLVSPGVATRETPTDIRRRRLARLTCAAIAAGWALTVLSAAVQGVDLSRNMLLLAAVGAASGLLWGLRDWVAERDRSLQILMAAASLQACAAAVAFDRGAVAAWIFAFLLAAIAGQVGTTRALVAGQAGLLAAGQLAALAAPDRAADATGTAIVVAVAVLLIAAASRALVELREEARRRDVAGDVTRLHERLAETVAADPERFALLTLDLHGADPAEIRAIGERLAQQLRGGDLVARASAENLAIVADTDDSGAAALARRMEEAMAQYRRDEVGHLNAAIGIAMYPRDGRTPDELLARAGAALDDLRAAADAQRVGPLTPH